MKTLLPIKKLVLFSLLGAAVFAAKLLLAPLPNIEPVSLLVILLAVCYGWQGLYPLYIYVFLELAVWGPGLWGICYLYVWLALFFPARLARKMEAAWGWAVLSGCFGLLFGALCALTYWAVGGWAAAVSWWVAGIPMDLLHGAGNFVITLVLFRPLRQGLEALNRHYGIC